MKEWGVLLVVGWSMLIGGVVLGTISRVWQSDEWSLLLDWKLSSLLLTVIVIGTVAFILFLSSMKYISAIETSILSSSFGDFSDLFATSARQMSTSWRSRDASMRDLVIRCRRKET
jgi:drug/metabolite transporter (DMT)-like permease